MLDKSQEQHVDQHGTAIQANGNVSLSVTHVGLTIHEAKELFNDLFDLNFYKLQGKAQATAQERNNEVTEKFLQKLQDEYPAGLQQSENPDFQDALFTVQKEYAKAGDKDLGDILVDLLVDRSKQETRNILQIVLNESLHAAPKLTNSQLAILSIIFCLRHVQARKIGNHQQLHEWLSKYIQSLANNIIASKSCFQHIVFTGCGSVSMGQITLEEIFQQVYPGLFNNGFEVTRIDELAMSEDDRKIYFVNCINDPIKFQVNAMNMETLEGYFTAHAVTTENHTRIIELFNAGRMNVAEIKAKVVEFSPFMEPIFVSWSASEMKNFELSSVGIAIGHANIKRLAGEFADLSIWIN